MVSSQAPDSVKEMVKYHITKLPGPKGDLGNEPYVGPMLNRCDGIAMFYYDGTLQYAWSQDEMNSWYWHGDFDIESKMSKTPYKFTQSDGSIINVENESAVVRDFIAGKTTNLFFNGCKFHRTKRDVWDDGIIFTVLGGADGRGLLTAISPDGYYMVVVSASVTAMPIEHFLGINTVRKQGETKRDLYELSAEFSTFAANALGI